jgi:hypothetical protein
MARSNVRRSGIVVLGAVLALLIGEDLLIWANTGTVPDPTILAIEAMAVLLFATAIRAARRNRPP